jgi:hypothetical protein
MRQNSAWSRFLDVFLDRSKNARNSAPNFKRLVVLFASDFALRGWTRQCGAVPN